MVYPILRPQISEDDLIAHFTLDVEDQRLIKSIRKDASRMGLAILLKTLTFLGYPPRSKKDVPLAVVQWIAYQMGLENGLFLQYRWKGPLWKHHLSLARQHTGFSSCGPQDQSDLLNWLTEKTVEFPSSKDLLIAAVQRYRDCKLELLVRRNFAPLFTRLGRSSLKTFTKAFPLGWSHISGMG